MVRPILLTSLKNNLTKPLLALCDGRFIDRQRGRNSAHNVDLGMESYPLLSKCLVVGSGICTVNAVGMTGMAAPCTGNRVMYMKHDGY